MATLNIEKYNIWKDIVKKSKCLLCNQEEKIIYGINEVSLGENKVEVESNFLFLNQIKKSITKKIKTEVSALPFVVVKCSYCLKADLFCMNEILNK